ncbi:uncharacterized protein B0H64DRAFT_369696 [Chaetomium fimeti]|uniref:Uncharacterized protein n=1 Tax=Chaetomium fimeti TaxID=1854472 RepID=A0AAE0HRF7_9PEZI|nr:hypothetical protein B0H64DRAFT_369696 [Chaetomium fimeti]
MGPRLMNANTVDSPVLSSGTCFRNRYVESGASTPIASLSHDLAVLQNSAQVFLQGLHPPAGSAATQKLANGTATDPPLAGYQYIPSSSPLTPEILHQLQTLADQHEWGLAYNASFPIRAVSSASTSTTSSGGDGGEGGGGVSRPAAGVIGAVVVLLLEAMVMAVAGLRVAKKKGLSAKDSQADDGSTSTR